MYQVLTMYWSLLNVHYTCQPIPLDILVMLWAGTVDPHLTGGETGSESPFEFVDL